jgi:hypothetical protein
VDPRDAENEPIESDRVAEIMRIIVQELQAPAPAGLSCRCGTAVAIGSVYCYRDEFFCSQPCCKSAVEKQQQLVSYFFRALKAQGVHVSGK